MSEPTKGTHYHSVFVLPNGEELRSEEFYPRMQAVDLESKLEEKRSEEQSNVHSLFVWRSSWIEKHIANGGGE